MKNIAAGLCGAFASRNNDTAGYWTIGKLRSLAAQHARSAVSLDVLAASMQPPAPEFAQVLADQYRLLQKVARRSGIRPEDITVAHILVDFAPQPWPRAMYFKRKWGDQYRVTVTVGAPGRADGVFTHAGYCRPHDPDRETRRAAG